MAIASALAVPNSSPRSLSRYRSDSSGNAGPSNRSQRVQNVFQNIVRTRKSWKSLRGDTEAVWPPELEAALIQGAHHHQVIERC
jgi:hypothetical protein